MKTIVCESNKVNNGGERARREEYERAVVLILVGRESQYKYFGGLDCSSGPTMSLEQMTRPTNHNS
jgi:hypothetical protein